MLEATKDYIINTVFRTNIVPVISECNTACVFCSHRQNPDGVEVFRMPRWKAEDFAELIPFLSPKRKIIIGESATRIIEGEPLLHPEILQIVENIRAAYPCTPVQITTNGLLLDEGHIRAFEALGGIEFNVSVNAVGTELRRSILGVQGEKPIRETLLRLKGRIPFSGSCVWVPDRMTREDIREVAALLEESGADSMRLFLPGYTAKAGKTANYFELFNLASEWVKEFRRNYALPILIEPAYLSDLTCRVEGVVRESPAYAAGLHMEDIITRINGKPARTRVETFDLAFRLSNPELTVLRDGEEQKIKLVKPRHTSPGFVVLYDMDPEMASRISDAVLRYEANRVLLVTSELAYEILLQVLRGMEPTWEYRVIKAENRFFGGNIKCAGLLTVSDIQQAVEAADMPSMQPDLILLPPVMFDFKGRDLLGVQMKELEAKLGVPVERT